MYARRALVTFKSLRPVCKARTSVLRCPFLTPSSVRNLSTASERLDLYNNFERNTAENHADYGSYDHSGRVYDRNLGGVEQNQNPRGVYGQKLNGGYGEFGGGRSDVSDTIGGGDAQNRSEYDPGDRERRFSGGGIAGGEQIRNPNRLYGQNFDAHQQNSDFNGYGSRGIFSGQSNLSRQSVQNAENYQQNWNGNRVGGITGSQIESAEVAEGTRFRSKIEDLDEFIKEGKLKEAVELLGVIDNESLSLDLPRYVSLMQACGENEALDEAKSVHEHLIKSMPNLEVKTHNLILEMYSKCGSMKDAFSVFDQMPQRNLTSWDIMISWLAKNGLWEDSIDLFTEFKNSGLKPDGQMFVGVFSACGFLCDIVEGMLHFESMTKDYGIAPTMEHYVSIVEMLGNAGFLNEALEFIEKMPIKPDVNIWETLMKFSRLHGNTELGDRCAELVELLDPSCLNEQSRAGLIPINASDIAREKEKKKSSGQNPLDVRSRVHEYRAGDRSHPDNDRIYTLLRGLKQQMKEVGYIPETKFVLHDVDQEVKEEALMAHSERLAAAQGFLTSAARSPLRIIKNLRVCGDCHNAFKIISKIVGREIIARDSKRFHHFRDGSCSCNDYW
ncbi:hypothetical protein ABFS83_09G121500 [Erythranthe nasuta]